MFWCGKHPAVACGADHRRLPWPATPPDSASPSPLPHGAHNPRSMTDYLESPARIRAEGILRCVTVDGVAAAIGTPSSVWGITAGVERVMNHICGTPKSNGRGSAGYHDPEGIVTGTPLAVSWIFEVSSGIPAICRIPHYNQEGEKTLRVWM